MKEWLLSVTAVILFFVLCELLIAEGNVKKYAMGFIKVALVFVMIAPILKNASGEGFSFGFLNESSTWDTDSMEKLARNRYDSLERRLENDLSKDLCEGAEVRIDLFFDAGTASVNAVTVDLNQAVIISESDNTIVTEEIKNRVRSLLNVEKERVSVDGMDQAKRKGDP